MSQSAVRVVVRFHGTRGSVPTPDPETARCGGNTSCVEVETPTGRRIILDAGTGIRRLARSGTRTFRGPDRASANGAGTHGQPHPPAPEDRHDLDFFLTHFHWDHVQGLPFHPRLHDPDAIVRIHAPRQDDLGIDELLGGRLAPVYFPVPLSGLAARLSARALEDGRWCHDDAQVDSTRVDHPSSTHGLRVRSAGAAIVYVPDNELVPGTAAYERVADFAAGADLLIHDAMYTTGEYAGRRGWGHSTFAEAVRFAERAGVRALRLFHHHPDRSDAALYRILHAVRRDLRRRGSSLDVDLAREGEAVTLPAPADRPATPASDRPSRS